MMRSMLLKCGSNIKATMLQALFRDKDSAKLRKWHNTLMTSTTILPYKISISWSNSPHWNGGTITVQLWYFILVFPMIVKRRDNRSDNNQYPLLWFNKLWWTTGFKVSIIIRIIAHMSLLGTLACKYELCQV